jgi:hypothetical protein
LIGVIFEELARGQLSDPIRLYLLDAVRRIQSGENANAALHLTRPRKRPPETDRLINIAIAIERGLQSGKDKPTALADVARDLGREDTRDIEKAHSRFRIAARAALALERDTQIGATDSSTGDKS